MMNGLNGLKSPDLSDADMKKAANTLRRENEQLARFGFDPHQPDVVQGFRGPMAASLAAGKITGNDERNIPTWAVIPSDDIDIGT